MRNRLPQILILILCGVGYFPVLLAQEETIFRIKSGQEAQQALPMQVKYRYETFQHGTISFYNGKTSSGKLNYNLLLGDMQFVNPARDTLSLANEQTIRQIRLGGDTFYYDARHGYIEVVQTYPLATLAIQQKLLPLSKEKMGAYEQSSGVSSIREYGSINTGTGATHQLELKGDLLITKKVTYLLIDKNQRVRRANRSGILRLFAQDKKEINAFIEEQRINFNQLEDLQSLLEFCQQITS
ncbi:MAG: hypothetical protein RIG62_08165 [Cyclobacteriaceae bacterium]